LSLFIGGMAAEPPSRSFAQREPTALQPVTPSRWSDPATWPGGFVPAAGARVIIPAGRTILLDVVTPRLASLRIDGALVADDRDVGIDAGGIEVYGRLEIGTSDRPFAHRATLTLWGRPTAQS